MKKEDLPQDKSALENFTREVCYVKNKNGKYEAGLSTGWEAKTVALDQAWNEIDRRIEEAKQDVLAGKSSPIAYYLEKCLMDLMVLSGYTGFAQWRIKRHLKPNVFKRLNDKKLKKYAEAFEIALEDLKQFNP